MINTAEFLVINNNNTRTKFALAGRTVGEVGSIRSIESK